MGRTHKKQVSGFIIEFDLLMLEMWLKFSVYYFLFAAILEIMRYFIRILNFNIIIELIIRVSDSIFVYFK